MDGQCEMQLERIKIAGLLFSWLGKSQLWAKRTCRRDLW